MAIMRKILLWLGATTVVVLLGGALALAATIYWLSRDLPDHSGLQAYSPPVLSRVHSSDGVELASFARENRVFTPIEEIPDLVKQAFLSAEDRNFYFHGGVDPVGILRASVRNALSLFTGRRLQGASTITQQVAKNMLLTNEFSVVRKLREGILAVRLGRTLSKDQILELYLNEIFLGARAYGVAAASVRYFGKSLDDLLLHEAAFLAALPKGPNNYHPIRHPERALARRRYVLDQMVRNGYVDSSTAVAAAALPLGTLFEREVRPESAEVGGYFVEAVRRQLIESLGADEVYEGGLSIRTTLSRDMQLRAEAALRASLEAFDRARGYAGPVARIDDVAGMAEEEWHRRLRKIPAARDVPGWRLAVVLELLEDGVRIGVEGEPAKPENRILLSESGWARARLALGERVEEQDGRRVVHEAVELGPVPETPADIWAVGDVIHVAGGDYEPDSRTRFWSLRQAPTIQGAVLAMDPRNGRILAMQGGFSFQSSSFNRATQARRQPGSAFKPLVYAAALDHGFRPTSLVLDAPLALEQGAGLEQWRPRNSNTTQFAGPAPLRRGLEESRNLMTIRVARDIGLEQVADYSARLGLYDSMPLVPAYVLGAGETTLERIVQTYAVFANGGSRVEPTLLDRIQDRRGRTLHRRDDRPCLGCNASDWIGQEEPFVPESGDRTLDPVTAYQVTSLLEGVVQRGTGRRVAIENVAVAGKTGTTNALRDAWFIGYTPEIVVGCYIGYDEPMTLGRGGSGGSLCGPVVRSFLLGTPSVTGRSSFPPPAGVEFAPVDRFTGERVADSAEGNHIIREAFRMGDAPTLVAGGSGAAASAPGATAGEVRSGTGGLY